MIDVLRRLPPEELNLLALPTPAVGVHLTPHQPSTQLGLPAAHGVKVRLPDPAAEAVAPAVYIGDDLGGGAGGVGPPECGVDGDHARGGEVGAGEEPGLLLADLSRDAGGSVGQGSQEDASQ